MVQSAGNKGVGVMEVSQAAGLVLLLESAQTVLTLSRERLGFTIRKYRIVAFKANQLQEKASKAAWAAAMSVHCWENKDRPHHRVLHKREMKCPQAKAAF